MAKKSGSGARFMRDGSDTRFLVKVKSYDVGFPRAFLKAGDRVGLVCNYDKREHWKLQKLVVEKKRMQGAASPYVNCMWSPGCPPAAPSLVGFTEQAVQSFDYATRYLDSLHERFLIVKVTAGALLAQQTIGEARISILDIVRAGGGSAGGGDHVVSCKIKRTATLAAKSTSSRGSLVSVSEIDATDLLDITLRIRFEVVCHTRVEISVRELSLSNAALKYSAVNLEFYVVDAEGAAVRRAKAAEAIPKKTVPIDREYSVDFVATLSELLAGYIKLSFVCKAPLALKAVTVATAKIRLTSFLPLLERACTNGPVSSVWDGEGRWFTAPASMNFATAAGGGVGVASGALTAQGCVSVANAPPDLLEELPAVAVANPTFAVRPLDVAAREGVSAPHLVTLQDDQLVWSTAAESTRCRICKQWPYERITIALAEQQDSNHKWDRIALVVAGDGGEAPQRFAFRIASKRVTSLVQEAAGRKVKARLARERAARVVRLMRHAMNTFAATMVDGGGEAPPLPGNPLSKGSSVLFVVARHHMYLADVKTNTIVAGWKSEQLVGWHVTLHARTLTLSVLVGSKELSAVELQDPAFAQPVHFTIAMKDDPDVVSGVIQARVRALFAELRLRRMAAAQWDANFSVQIVSDATEVLPLRAVCVLTLDTRELRFEDLASRACIASWPYESLLEAEGVSAAGTATFVFDNSRNISPSAAPAAQYKITVKVMDRDAAEINAYVAQRYEGLVQQSAGVRATQERAVGTLVEMGFPRGTALEALRASGGEVQRAVDVLTSSGVGNAPPGGTPGADKYEVCVPAGEGPLGLQLGAMGVNGAAVAAPLLASGRIARSGQHVVSIGDELIAVNGLRIPNVETARAILGGFQAPLRLLFNAHVGVTGQVVAVAQHLQYTVQVSSPRRLGLALAVMTGPDGAPALVVQQLLQGELITAPNGTLCAPGHSLVSINGMQPSHLAHAVQLLATRPLTLVFERRGRRRSL